MKYIFFNLFLWLLSSPPILSSSVVCPSLSQTYTTSIVPTSDTLYIKSLSSHYQDYNVVWSKSASNTIEVSAVVCSGDSTLVSSLALTLTNKADGVYLELDEHHLAATSGVYTTTTGASSATGSVSTGGGGSTTSDGSTAPPTQAPVDPTSAPTLTPTLTPTSEPTNKPVNSSVNTSDASIIKPLNAVLFVSLFAFFTNKRLAAILFALALVLSLAHANDSSSATVTITISVPLSIYNFCVGDNKCFNRDSGVITKYVSMFGTRYASLDSIYGGKCNASTIMRVPDGWSIANVTSDALLITQIYNWNTYAILLSDGNAYYTGQYGVISQYSALMFHPDHFGPNNGGYTVMNCDSIILITQKFPVPEQDHDIIGIPTISNFITFGGFDFAAADNTRYDNITIGCQTYGVFIDSSTTWQVAPDDDATAVAIQSLAISYGTQCVVVANGNSYQQNLAACDVATALVTTPYNGGNIYTVKACNKRILLRRASTLPNSWPTQVAITNTYLSGGAFYATLDNTPPLDSTVAGCQSRFLSVPAGWSLVTSAQLTAFMTAVGFGAWSSTYCVATTGLAVGHTNVACAATLLTKTVNGVKYYSTVTCGKVLLVKTQAKATDFTIGLKILVIAVQDTIADVGLKLAKTMFNATGAAYEVLPLLDSSFNSIYPGDLPLLDSTGNPKYYAIIVTSGKLSYTNPTTKAVVKALTVSQQTQLTLYKYQYSIRYVALTSYPDPTQGLSLVAGGGPAPANTFITLDPSWVAGNPTAVAGLVPTATFDISNVYYVAVGYTSSNIVPVLRFTSNSSDVPTASSQVGAAVITLNDGTQELHFFIGNSDTYPFGPLLGSVWLQWVTKGLWIGSRRVHLIPQIDDLFLSTEQFDNQRIANRMTGDDLAKTNQFFIDLLPSVPTGSKLICEFGVNGNGVVKRAGTNTINDPLYDKVVQMISLFNWESHTFTHMNFDCPNDNCVEYGTTTYAQALQDLTLNTAFFTNTMFAGLGGLDAPTFSKNCIITPAITGLFNPNAIKAILDAGIKCVVGDNSQARLLPENLYHGIITSVAVHGYDGLFIIPRAPTEIYYDVESHESEVIEFNTRYGIGGSIIPGAANHTLEFIYAQEATRAMSNLMLFRHDPYMFHQANMMHFTYARPGEAAREWSLFTMWMQYVVEKYNQVMSFPLLNVKHDDLYSKYLERMARDACGISGSLTVAGGRLMSATISSTNTCKAGVTGLTSCTGAAAASNCKVEHYGPDFTAWVDMASNSVTLPVDINWN